MEPRDLGAPDLRIHYIKVVNRLDIPFTDRWDGIPVAIMPGKTETLQLDMAAHFFGYYYGADPAVMFRHTCKRQGWNTPAHLKVGDSGKTLAEDLFAGIEITPVIYKMVEEKPDLDAPILADPGPPEKPVDDLPPSPRRKAGAA
jgi:hypothetical protein